MRRVYTTCLALTIYVLVCPLAFAEQAQLSAGQRLDAARAQIALLQSQIRLLQAQNQALLSQIEAMKAQEQYRTMEASITGDAACRLTDTQTVECPTQEVKQDAKLDPPTAGDQSDE